MDAGAAAQAYDRWFDEPWGRYAFAVEARGLSDAMGPVNGQRVLDAGCGSGRFTWALARGGARVVGLDADPSMLRIAGSRNRGAVLLGDVHALPFSDGAFDTTVAVTVCEFSDRPQAVVDELPRVTRRGGRIVLGALNPRSAWGFMHRSRFRDPPWSAARFISASELRRMGEQHGRTRVRSALYAPAAFPGLRVAGWWLEALRWVAPALGAFRVVLITRD